jgi:DNA-binding transcriptional ArsR family regulator
MEDDSASAREPTLTTGAQEQLLAVLTATANPHRLRIIAELAGGRVHVSELARRLEMSRPLLYMHLDKLAKAGLVTGHLELSEDGRAMKYYELAPFELRLNAQTIEAVYGSGERSPGRPRIGTQQADETKESDTR